MQIAVSIIILIASYVIGSTPSGLIIVKLISGKDVRTIESGRTGGTNAMRAAGIWAGLGTAILDVLKSAVCVWLVRWLLPGSTWMEIFAPLLAILGHNYSLFLVERNEQGRIRFHGGAGGGPAVGGAFGLWMPSILIIVPIGAIIIYLIGYASVTTMSIPIMTLLIFAYRTWSVGSPWQYIVYGLLAELLLIWALRPNIQRLMNGTERLVGLRARRKKKQADQSSSSTSTSS